MLRAAWRAGRKPCPEPPTKASPARAHFSHAPERGNKRRRAQGGSAARGWQHVGGSLRLSYEYNRGGVREARPTARRTARHIGRAHADTAPQNTPINQQAGQIS